MPELYKITRRIFANRLRLEEIRDVVYSAKNVWDHHHFLPYLMEWYPDQFNLRMSEYEVKRQLAELKNQNDLGADYLLDTLYKGDSQADTELSNLSSQALYNIYSLLYNEPQEALDDEDYAGIFLSFFSKRSIQLIIKLVKSNRQVFDQRNIPDNQMGWLSLLFIGLLKKDQRLQLHRSQPLHWNSVFHINKFFNILDTGDEDDCNLAQLKAQYFDPYAAPLGFHWEWAKTAPLVDDTITHYNAKSNYFAHITHPTGFNIWLCPSYGLTFSLNYALEHDNVLREHLWEEAQTLAENNTLGYGDNGDSDDYDIHIDDYDVNMDYFSEVQVTYLQNALVHYSTTAYQEAIINGGGCDVGMFEVNGQEFEGLRQDWGSIKYFFESPNLMIGSE